MIVDQFRAFPCIDACISLEFFVHEGTGSRNESVEAIHTHATGVGSETLRSEFENSVNTQVRISVR